MLHDTVKEYWDAKRKREGEKLNEAARSQIIVKHLKELGREEISRQLKSGELEAWARANGLHDEQTAD